MHEKLKEEQQGALRSIQTNLAHAQTFLLAAELNARTFGIEINLPSVMPVTEALDRAVQMSRQLEEPAHG